MLQVLSVFILSWFVNLLKRFQLLEMLLDCPWIDFLEVLTKGNWLLGPIGILLVLPKDGLDLIVQPVSAVSDEQDLKCLFNRYPPFEHLVVH